MVSDIKNRFFSTMKFYNLRLVLILRSVNEGEKDYFLNKKRIWFKGSWP